MSWFQGFEHIVSENEPMAAHTWLRIGGPAEYFAEPTDLDQLRELVTRCREESIALRLLGEGSNLLVPDQGVPGLVLKLSSASFGIGHVDDTRLKIGGGAPLSQAIAIAAGAGLAGLEGLSGIPGTVGGAIHGNAGERGADIGRSLVEATVLTRTGELITRTRDQMQFSYRESSLNELAIVDATFDLEQEDPAEMTKRMQKQWILKRAADPDRQLNVCCMFKDPMGMTAGELIEQTGLKGSQVGAARTYERATNYLVASEGATSQDVKQLLDDVKRQVFEQTGIELSYAVQCW